MEETLPLVGCYHGSHHVCRLTSAVDRHWIQVLTVSDSSLVSITPIISDWSKVPHFKMWLHVLDPFAGFPTKWNGSQGFEFTVGEVKGRWRDGWGGRPGEPCLQGSHLSRGSRMRTRAHHAQSTRLTNPRCPPRCMCACRENENTVAEKGTS